MYLSLWYHVCTKAIIISKGSCGYGESKNVFLKLVQERNLPVRTCKSLHLMWGSLRLRTEICGSSGLPFAMVSYLHQTTVHIKRKLLVCRVQKCIPLVGTKTALTCAGMQTTTSRVRRYKAENGNFWKFWSTFHHGTMFAPKQFLYQKEATGMEYTKMYSSRRCKNRTYLCVPANYPISCEAVYSRERKFTEVLMYLSPWYHVCTKAIFISKGSCGYGESKNVFL